MNASRERLFGCISPVKQKPRRPSADTTLQLHLLPEQPLRPLPDRLARQREQRDHHQRDEAELPRQPEHRRQHQDQVQQHRHRLGHQHPDRLLRLADVTVHLGLLDAVGYFGAAHRLEVAEFFF